MKPLEEGPLIQSEGFLEAIVANRDPEVSDVALELVFRDAHLLADGRE